MVIIENINLNELVEELYKNNDDRKFKILSLKATTIYFIDKHAFTVDIKIKTMATESMDEVIKQAEIFKKFREEL